MEPTIDESSPHYRDFVECFMQGASLQDIYAASAGGFAVNAPADPSDPAVRKRRMRSCRVQFLRIFEHQRNIVEPVERHLGLQGKRVLDFGCGTGALSIALALRGAEVLGVDPTTVSLEAARHRALYFGCEARFQSQLVGTAPGLPFADQAFDMVILNSVMEFIPERRDAYVRDFLRLLRPGGHLVISTQNGIFPRDYYTGHYLPLFRRHRMLRENLPFGVTYFELRRWVNESARRVEDLSRRNLYNSVDKWVARQRGAGRRALPAAVGAANTVLKSICRAMGLPSDILFPYATYIFRVVD